MADPLAERHAAQARLMGLAREFVERASRRMPIVAAAVVGSVARGDFNVWSDIDVIVIADALPEAVLERQALMIASAPPGIQAVAKGNRLAREALDSGVPLAGDAFFAAQRAAAS